MKEAEIILAVVLMGGLAVLTPVGIIVVSALIGPSRKKSKTKFDTYECGVPILDSARRRFSIKFYLVGLIFMLFDIETVFLMADEEYTHVSSSLIRELTALADDESLARFVPLEIVPDLRERLAVC